MKDRLSLFEYSIKYGISISTLRRRIRNNEIPSSFQAGRYFLKDAPLEASSTAAEIAPPNTTTDTDSLGGASNTGNPEVILELKELKALVLELLRKVEALAQGTDVINLKDELADQKTLVKVLEGENERLKSLLTRIPNVDWDESSSLE